MKLLLRVCIIFLVFVVSKTYSLEYSFYPKEYIKFNKSIVNIEDIDYVDYSQSLKILDFPMTSKAVWFNKIFLLDVLFELYNILAYSPNINTKVYYLAFYRTLKEIEIFVSKNRKISVFYQYSSTMQNYYDNMIRNLSISYNKFNFDTHMYIGFNFYIS
ncbi:hypothetical protein [Brachyspira pilosicoli]|uniref:hypothetical protein n=1 Tax=Brachyspira pilosicoli TaxID=52584 RepID=UPI00243036AA|nr:hypothetical protein [Brachyspira pilosicoli]